MKDALDALNLDALTGEDGPGFSEQELAENGKEILWLADEMPPPENIAYTLRRMDAGLSELLETQAATVEVLREISGHLATLAGAAKSAAAALAPEA